MRAFQHMLALHGPAMSEGCPRGAVQRLHAPLLFPKGRARGPAEGLAGNPSRPRNVSKGRPRTKRGAVEEAAQRARARRGALPGPVRGAFASEIVLSDKGRNETRPALK
eukprot:CAMPEP_0184099590 /NCGR_PEP_ID=MMETSP0974-20121125/11902_1 /TAXON_ID=483370 /ORGANISM="non described non described, Strain CCMP2097" /LENGTH=108 /DNA_ID=CAMNT_0026402505 /DNA_START=255 /DNA_END=581 /DNA_ORIENTATION=-